MSADVAISVENLSKAYLIGHQSARAERYIALRDVFARNARSVVRKTRDMIAGRPVVQGDEVEEFWALKDVSFELRRGDVVGVIGRNGAGKSTLLKVLSRITEPTKGRIEIRGRVASLLEVGTGFHLELTGRENIYLNGAVLGMKRAEIRSKFDEIVAFAEVERFLDTPVKRYSSGMYVRLAFAVAAHLEPEILVVDEVLAVGDAEFQKKCLGKMRDVAGHGRTVLFVSHNMAAVRALCEKSLLLVSGRLIEAGDTAAVILKYVDDRNDSATFSRPPLRSGKPHVVAASIIEMAECKQTKQRLVKIHVTVHSLRSMSVEICALIRDNLGSCVGYAPVGALMSHSPAQLAAGTTAFLLTINVTCLALGHYSLTLQVSTPFAEIFDNCHDCLTFQVNSEHFSDVLNPLRQDWQVGSVLFMATIEKIQ